MSARERIQKNKEWTSIENIVPIIEKHLQLSNIYHDRTYELDPEKDNEFNDFIKASPFDRIVITSVMSNDINWLKGCP